LIAVPLRQLKPEHIAIKGERAIKISHLQVDVPDANV
jgi:hypothetical protein